MNESAWAPTKYPISKMVRMFALRVDPLSGTQVWRQQEQHFGSLKPLWKINLDSLLLVLILYWAKKESRLVFLAS